MPKQIEVLAEDISRDDMGQKTELFGTTRILTYKSFQYLNSNPENPRYKLLYQVDEKGNEVPGSPNLSAEHRQALPKRSAEPVVEVRQHPIESPEVAKQAEVADEVKTTPLPRRGRPKQNQELQETVA
jgi:hypothetical protein